MIDAMSAKPGSNERPGTPEAPNTDRRQPSSTTPPTPPSMPPPMSPPAPSVMDTGHDAPAGTGATSVNVYLTLVRRSGASREELLALGYDQADLDLALHSLFEAGVIHDVAGRWEPAPPDVALPRRAAQLEREAYYLRTVTSEISDLYWRSRSISGEAGTAETVVLNSRQEVESAAATILASARTRVVGFRDNSPLTTQFFATPVERHREKLLSSDHRPLLVQMIYESSVLTYPNAGEVLQARAEAGETTRVIDRLPFTLLIADTTAALLDLTTYDSCGSGSLLIRERRMVVALAALADTFWGLALPTSLGNTGLDSQTGYVLSLLAVGATDSAIAAQTGLSLRTIERRVKALLEQLGATTRFQAGVQAARRGWI